jgi:hypothetical protein
LHEQAQVRKETDLAWVAVGRHQRAYTMRRRGHALGRLVVEHAGLGAEGEAIAEVRELVRDRTDLHSVVRIRAVRASGASASPHIHAHTRAESRTLRLA